MPIHVLKTELDSDRVIDTIRPILNSHPAIIDWHVDIHDIDNVLRIESLKSLTEKDIILLLSEFNINSETL